MRELTSDNITMMCIWLCERVGGIINQEMSMSTIYYLKENRDEAIKKFKSLVQRYGNNTDRQKLNDLKKSNWKVSNTTDEFK